MSLKIEYSPKLITPELDRSMKNNIARKSGNKHVSGDTYKKRKFLNKALDFVASTRAIQVVGKAHFESKQYAQAAILRKDFKARETAAQQQITLSDEEYDSAVWNSNGVQNRLTREDHVRYGVEYYDYKLGEETTPRNRWALRFSKVSHTLHGLCEINAAPTGMSYNTFRNLGTSGVDDKSTKNKVMMFGLLGFIGVGTTELLNRIKGLSNSRATWLGQSVVGLLVAFPVASSALGLLGFCTGMASQMCIQKQNVNTRQKELLSKGISENLQKILSQLKSIKDKPELIQVMAKAMQGKFHIQKKIKSDSLDHEGVPIILRNALAAIDLSKSDIENMEALKDSLGEYMQVEKPQGNDATRWKRYCYAKAVTAKESHYVALASTVDHMEVSYRHAPELKDARRYTEEVLAPKLHNFILRTMAYPATLIDYVADTKIAPTLRKWATPEYQKKQASKLSDPARASENCFRGQYMAKNIHQYGPVTQSLIKISEGMRLLNMNVVLASNANLSRVFNNMALGIHGTLGTGPASRSMCNSVGRFFGGALLAVIFGTFIPVAADATGHPSTISTNGKLPVDFSMTNIGILMFLLSTPTLLVEGLAQVAARLEGWNGNIIKTAPPGVRTFQFAR
ncbi:MAG: hypothetical protein ACK5Q1_08705 [Limnobacter sp.]